MEYLTLKVYKNTIYNRIIVIIVLFHLGYKYIKVQHTLRIEMAVYRRKELLNLKKIYNWKLNKNYCVVYLKWCYFLQDWMKGLQAFCNLRKSSPGTTNKRLRQVKLNFLWFVIVMFCFITLLLIFISIWAVLYISNTLEFLKRD